MDSDDRARRAGRAAPGDRVFVVGSSSANDMMVLGHDRMAEALWPPKNVGKGRLRAVTTDSAGMVYAVGTSDGEGTAGLIFKFNASGIEIDRDQLNLGTNMSFHDVAVFEPGTGVIAAQSEETGFDFGWLQVEFDCDVSCAQE